MLLLLLPLIAAQGEAPVAGLRPLRVAIYQSGKIEVDGKPVTPSNLAARLRSARGKAEILCVWRERKVMNGRPAYDLDNASDMQRLKTDMRVTGILAEASRTYPSFDQRDAPCQGMDVKHRDGEGQN